jgi:Leucine-rich repeat (LRR) protein
MYVIHELMHDMAKLVSENEWFVVKGETDLQKIPQDIRHLSIVGGNGLSETNLRVLCKYKKLRSIVCHGLDSEIITPAAKCWFEVLTKIRMLGFLSCKLNYLPENIGNLKLLQCLNIGECTFEELPPSFWKLQSLRIVDAQNCRIQHIPEEFNQLRGKLQRFKLRGIVVREPGNYAV